MVEPNDDIDYRAKLKNLVEIIQEVKAENEYLVGTQDIWRLIKGRRLVYYLPIKTTNSINRRLEEQFSKVTYRATSERLNGLNDFLESDGMFDLSSPRGLIASSGMKFFDDNSIVDIDTTEAFYPIFANANRAQIIYDDELGDIVAATMRGEYDKTRSKINGDDKKKYDDYVRRKIEDSKSFDWIKGCSLEKLRSFERYHLRCLIEDEISYVKMIERAQNELVDHRLFVKRAILSNYLSTGLISFIGEISEFSPSWNSFKTECEFRIRNLSDDLNNPERFYEELKEFGIESKFFTEIIDMNKRTLNALRYLRQIIGSEKKWIEKVLKD